MTDQQREQIRRDAEDACPNRKYGYHGEAHMAYVEGYTARAEKDGVNDVCPQCGAGCFADIHTPASDHPELTTSRLQCEQCDWYGDERHVKVEQKPAEGEQEWCGHNGSYTNDNQGRCHKCGKRVKWYSKWEDAK